MIKKIHLKNSFLIFLFLVLIIFPIIIISANLNETQQIIARDSKRISDISTLYSKIEKYKTEYGYYPKIDPSDSSYKINGFVSSTMTSDWNNFSSSIGVSNIVDPINKNVRNIKVIASPYEPDIVSKKCSTSALDTGIYIDGTKIYGYTRGYIVSNFDSNWNYVKTKAYDTYGSSQEAINMRDYIATIPQENYIVIYTYDEPRQNIDIIWNTLLNLGASNKTLDKIGNNPECGYRSAYILIGKRNLYRDNAFYEAWGPRGAGNCMGCPISYEFSVDSLNKSLYGDYGYAWTKGSSAYHYIYCPKDTYSAGDNCNTAGASLSEDSFYLELDLEDLSRIEDWGLQDNPHIFYSKEGANIKIYSNNTSVCGNSVLEGREECEIGSSPKLEACVSGLESGYKVFNCNFDTCLYEEENLESPKECILKDFYCGDGIIQSENNEECEGGYEELCSKNFGEQNWYNTIIRYCNNSCRWNRLDNINKSDCGGYCGDGTVQKEFGEDCDDETTNCVDCKYLNKSPNILDIITSSVRDDYEGADTTPKRANYETPGVFKDSKYFILKADVVPGSIIAGNTYYKWKITRATNYEFDIRNSFSDLSFETSSIMKTDGSFETEYIEGLDSIRIYPTGSDLNAGGDEIFDHNYTGVYNVILYMKNRYTETETGTLMYSREVSRPYDFAIGSVCGDHIVQTPNSSGKDEYCEWKKGYYRDINIEDGTRVYNTNIYGGGKGVDATDQYYCNNVCNDAGGWCGDGYLQAAFEKCDPSAVINNEGFDIYGTGFSADKTYSCSNSCIGSDYCGDGYLQVAFEKCDPTHPVSASDTINNLNLQYLCKNELPTDESNTPWVLSEVLPKEGDDGINEIEYVKNDNPNATCSYSYGGYCGDGIIQHNYLTKIEDGKTVYTGTVNTKNPGIEGDYDLYSGRDGSEPLLEECDPYEFDIPSGLISNFDYTYSCTTGCKLSGGYCGDGTLQHGIEVCDKAEIIYVTNVEGDISIGSDGDTLINEQSCKSDCSGCLSGYVLEDGKCIYPDMGYTASLDGISSAIECNTTSDENVLTIEQYDPRADNDKNSFSEFLAPNSGCPQCEYTSWGQKTCTRSFNPETSNIEDVWHQNRGVTHKETAEYCQETDKAYGSCDYCGNPEKICYLVTERKKEESCLDANEHYPDCDLGWTSYATGKSGCGLFNAFKRGWRDCKQEFICGSNNNCSCELKTGTDICPNRF